MRNLSNPPADRVRLIHQSLVHAILEQRLSPGTKLGEDELGQIYGASRTIVRAALQSLAHEGIIVSEKNRGAFVAQPTPDDAREVFGARRLIEPELARLAAAHAELPRPIGRTGRTGGTGGTGRTQRSGRTARTGSTTIDFSAHLAAERAAVAAGDDGAAIRLSGEFHLLIAAQAGHRIYENVLHELVTRSSLIILLYRSRTTQVCGTHHHEMLAQAIADGDADLAARLMDEHLREIEHGLDLGAQAPQARSLAEILGR